MPLDEPRVGLREVETLMKARNHAFTLVELLVVIGIIAVMMSILLPALSKSRQAAQRVVCGSNLRQIGVALQNYVTDSRGHLPTVVEPIWFPGAITLNTDFTVDPFETLPNGQQKYPFAFANVMKSYLKDSRVLICPGALRSYPEVSPAVSYRFASTNASDGVARTYDSFTFADGTADYIANFKYLNYRKHRLEYVDIRSGSGVWTKGVGDYFLARDFKTRNPAVTNPPLDPSGGTFSPHSKSYNRLRIDFSVSLDNDNGTIMRTAFP